jgi:hypothetical protein
MRMKMKKTYAIIPEDRQAEFMRLVPTARLHAWPNTWAFATSLKPTVDAFLGPKQSADAVEADAFPPPAAPTRSSTNTVLSLSLSTIQIHALERVLKNITAGTTIAFARNEAEKADMQSALNALKSVLREHMRRSG